VNFFYCFLICWDVFPSTYCANDVIVIFFTVFWFVGTCFPGHNVLILFTNCFGTGWCPYDTSLDWRLCVSFMLQLWFCHVLFAVLFLISCAFRILQLLCFVFWLWTILNRALQHGLRDSVVVSWNWNSDVWNLFLTTTFDGTVGSLTCRWGSLLSIPDAFFQLHLPRTLWLIHLPQYCLNWLYLHCI
jgi:hypothetical protein